METVIRLDTHVVIWLYTGEIERLSPKAADLIARAELLISPIVNLELAYLNETGKLKVSGAAIFLDLQERIGLMESSQSLAAVVAAAADQSWTRDPFDRLIVGDSLSANCTLLSKDATILAHCGLAEW